MAAAGTNQQVGPRGMRANAAGAVTIVSGLPRSGTSMMMRMLEAGGLEALTDHERVADADNPNGYYEFERVKQVKHDKAWLPEAQGKVVKMVSALLKDLPGDYHYRIVFMRRKMSEILASQRQMLVRQGKPTDVTSDERMAAMFEKHLEQVQAWIAERPNVDVVYVDYNRLLVDPAGQIESINALFESALDAAEMLKIVDPDLYRQRS